MNQIIQTLWSRTEIVLWPENYLLVSLPHESLIEALSMVSAAAGHFSAIVVEKDEVSLTMEEELWKSQKLESLGLLAGGIVALLCTLLPLRLVKDRVCRIGEE